VARTWQALTLEAPTLEALTSEVWIREAQTWVVWTRERRAAADRDRCVLFRLRRAFPPAGHSRQDEAGRNWVSHSARNGHHGQHLLRTAAWVRTAWMLAGWMVAGRAVPAYRTRDGQLLDGRTWERRIWLAWGRWALHLAEDRFALLHHAPDSTDRKPANDWPHRRTGVLKLDLERDPEPDPEPDPGDDPESIGSGWGPRAHAHPVGRASGTARSPLSLNQYRAGRGASALGGTGNRRGRRRAEDGERSRTSSPAGPRVRVVLVLLHPTRRVDLAGLRQALSVFPRSEHPQVRRPV
jgi:hypothetical protein